MQNEETDDVFPGGDDIEEKDDRGNVVAGESGDPFNQHRSGGKDINHPDFYEMQN